ncbi:MAG: enoyl-CoA hydratase/isomerase family protein, partial [Dehalococcoidia bacterium]
MSELLLVERQGHICTLTMNRPEKHNSVNPEMMRLMGDAFNAMRDDPGVRVIVLRGVGDRAFSSGYDIGRIDPQSAAAQQGQQVFYDAADG